MLLYEYDMKALKLEMKQCSVMQMTVKVSKGYLELEFQAELNNIIT